MGHFFYRRRLVIWLVFMVFHATFINISVILWRSVLLVEETGVPGKNPQPVASHWQTLSHNVVSSTPHHERDSNSSLGLFVFIFPYQWTMLVKYPLKYASKIVLYMLSIHIFKYLNRPITMIITNINSSSNQISK